MSELITATDPIIFHDQRPTHTARPDWLITAKQDMDRAWKRLYELVDIQAERGELDHDALDEARCLAEAQQTYYYDLCDSFNRGETPASVDFERMASAAGILGECGCTLPEQSCPACRMAASVGQSLSDIF